MADRAAKIAELERQERRLDTLNQLAEDLLKVQRIGIEQLNALDPTSGNFVAANIDLNKFLHDIAARIRKVHEAIVSTVATVEVMQTEVDGSALATAIRHANNAVRGWINGAANHAGEDVDDIFDHASSVGLRGLFAETASSTRSAVSALAPGSPPDSSNPSSSIRTASSAATTASDSTIRSAESGLFPGDFYAAYVDDLARRIVFPIEQPFRRAYYYAQGREISVEGAAVIDYYWLKMPTDGAWFTESPVWHTVNGSFRETTEELTRQAMDFLGALTTPYEVYWTAEDRNEIQDVADRMVRAIDALADPQFTGSRAISFARLMELVRANVIDLLPRLPYEPRYPSRAPYTTNRAMEHLTPDTMWEMMRLPGDAVRHNQTYFRDMLNNAQRDRTI